MPAIEVHDLSKSYGRLDVVRGISFEVQAGEVFALLGPNGAGKTTTVEILEGHRRRSGGEIRVLGVDPECGGRRFRDRIGVMLQSAGLDGELSVQETLSLYGSWYSRSLPTDELVALVGLQHKRRSRVKTLSGGQRRRLDLAVALVGDPELIFLDEPTVGFDPEARRGAWQLVQELRGLGRTIVLTSHYMDEVQHLADRAVVLAGGRIVAGGPPDRLGPTSHPAIVSFRLPQAARHGPLPGELRGAVHANGEIVLRTDAPTRALRALCDWAVRHDVDLEDLEVVRPSLEDVYLELTTDAGNGRH